MFNIVKSVIAKGTFDLRDILKKIDTIWLHGNLTEEQRAELIALAQGKAQACHQRAQDLCRCFHYGTSLIWNDCWSSYGIP